MSSFPVLLVRLAAQRHVGCSREVSQRLVLSIAVLALALASWVPQLLAPGRAAAFGVSLQTALTASPPSGSDGDIMLARVHGLGARLVRLGAAWSAVAPERPAPGFNPANPDDPSYHWDVFDRLITSAAAHGLEPIIDIGAPPLWAQAPVGAGETSPDPVQLGLFARAAATRYDGSRPGLPRVRYWEVWNEPNASFFLAPQIQAGAVVSVERYRSMVNEFAAGVHAVHADNVVIGGELFPNGLNQPGATAIAPLDFTRRMFCLSTNARPHLVCHTHVNVDVWSVHPYTSGGPSTRPVFRDNVWVWNLPALTKLINAAQRLGTLTTRGHVQLWVTEFSWNSNPPSHAGVGVPLRLEQRWVAETLFRSWSAGVSVFTWYTVRDEPLESSALSGGLYFSCASGIACDTPKPAAGAFRFPFVAYATTKRGARVWGRTPAGVRGIVRIQWLAGHGWRALATLRTDRDGIFTARLLLPRLANPKSAVLRAVELGAAASPSFSLNRPPDVLVRPFG